MPRELDPIWKHVERGENDKWKCKYCGTESHGRVTRIRAHLAGIPGYGIKVCEKVEDPVRAEALQKIKGKGSVLDISTGGTSGEGTKRIVIGASQSVLPSDNASDPNDMQNSGQLGCVPQQPSFHQPTGSGTAPACPQDQGSLPPGDRPLDNLDNTQQSDPSNHRLDAAHGNENASSLPQHLMDSSALPSLDLGELLEPLEQSTHLEFRDVITPDVPLHSPQSNLHNFPLENFHEFFAEVFKEIEADELHDPAVVSSLQIDPSLDVDRANRLQDCGQPRRVEVVPVPSNRSPTNIVQHPGQLPPRCDKEDGNDIRRFPSPTQMEIDPSSASLHTSDSHILQATIVDSLVVEASTDTVVSSSSHALVPPSLSQAPHKAPPPPQILPFGTGLIGPSSLPDMNEDVPMTSHPNTSINLEENRALKRKLELLYSKEADVRDELEFAASLSLKKPRTEVVNWLANVEKLRNDCPEATSEDCLPPQEQVDKLMHEAEDLTRQCKGLFEARETKVNKLLEEKMAGEAFRRNTTKILEYLVGNQVSRLGIYGMGGVGKTTIMVHIHNRLLEKANYGKVLWITVSKDFNIQRLQNAIAKELGLGILEEMDVRKQAAMLCNCLTKIGKSTIILDDVWEHFDPREVGIPIRADAIKLVLTTRSFEVCRQMQCQEKIKIEPLSRIEAERLFLKELGSEVAFNLGTEAIVKSIVKECAGLPLAIITMARSMRGVTDVFEWKDCLEKLRESDLGLTDMEKEVLMKLEFSYNRLGNDEVQQCFLSCAFYPEDELIDKFELIELFIDQGLIGRLSTREKQYDRGLTILNKLENVCLLEDHGSRMKMHDLIRDMALQIMRATAIVKAEKGLRRIPSEDYWTDALEKVSLMHNEIGEFPLNMSPNCPKLSTFLLNANYLNDVFIPDSFFKQLWGLNVLNLSGCNLRELPNSISNLVNLRALVLRYCRRLRRIPYLGKLRYLRKLDMDGCASLEAIMGLEMLVSLRYLDLSGTRIRRLPKGTLGHLLNLQYLKVEVVNEDVAKLWALETLECFFEDVDDFNKFVRVLSNQRNNPHCYEVDVCEEASLIYVQVIDDARFRKYDLSKQRNKPHYYKDDMLEKALCSSVQVNDDARFSKYDRSVYIGTWSYAIVAAGGERSGNCILIPQDVRFLTTKNCNGTRKLSDVGPLENLEELEIIGWENLWILCGGQDEEVIDICDSPAPTPTPLIFPSLRVLKISHAPKLKYLFGHGPKFSLPHLQKIVIYFCEEMREIIEADTSPPPHPPSAFPSLEDIIVLSCHKMKRGVEFRWMPHFPNLRRIQVNGYSNILSYPRMI